MSWRALFRFRSVLLLAGVAMIIVAYNTWSFCCGLCNFEMLLDPGLPGWLLLVAVGLEISAWGLLHWRNHRLKARLGCRCGRHLQEAWQYCPACGVQAKFYSH